jgi:two-component system, cell cycle sensor histidine kinase and response regulator CckA
MTSTGPATILFVDDEPMVRDVAAKSLAVKGYSVLTAVGGEEGLRLFKEHRGTIDIVVTDINMPDMSGPDMVEAIRRESSKVNILFISGNHDGLPEWAQETCGVLNKPFTPLELAASIEGCLQSSLTH